MPTGAKWENVDRQRTIAAHVADQYTETGANGNQNALSLFEFNLPGLVPTQNPIERSWLEIKGADNIYPMISCGRPFHECLTEEMPRLIREAGIRCRGMKRTFPMLHHGEACVTRDLALDAHQHLEPTRDPDSGEKVTNFAQSSTDPGKWYFNDLSEVGKETAKAITQDRISKREEAVQGTWSNQDGNEATAVTDYISFCNELHCVKQLTCPFGGRELFYVCDCEQHQVKGVCPHSIAKAYPDKVKKMKNQVILTGLGHERPKYNRKKKRKFTKAKSGESSNKRPK